VSRRTFGVGAAASAAAIGSIPGDASARLAPRAPPPLKASWDATAGFDQTGFISFGETAYESMRDDEARTPLFERAIRERVRGLGDSAVVLDLGTGPFALLALMAAKAGASKVYAVEASPEAAAKAREAVRDAERAGELPGGVVEVLEGFSTAIELPQKADLVLAEIVGSVASEEGLYATIRDAQARLVKAPHDPKSWIPAGCQTWAAPASFALHYVVAPPVFDRLGGVPIRLNCRDETLQLLSDPQLLEDISFWDPNLPAPGAVLGAPTALSFEVQPARVAADEAVYRTELLREGASAEEAAAVAEALSASLSGLAMWPRLVLDPSDETLSVDSRKYPAGEPSKSHWQTVLALLNGFPLGVTPGQAIDVTARIALPSKVDAPMHYDLSANIVRSN